MDIALRADDTVEELVERFPALVGVLSRRNILCIRCGEPVWGTLGELLATKMPAEQIDATIAELRSELSQAADT